MLLVEPKPEPTVLQAALIAVELKAHNQFGCIGS